MFKNIIFVGGIHGVGKSTICQQICSKLDIEYLSASELLKWKEINKDTKNKKVKNIPNTQNRLLTGLKDTLQEDKTYLLDGHYCLLNKDSKVKRISMDVFIEIKPKLLCLILGDVTEIKKRLEYRDNKPYECELLEQLQNSELVYAKYLSTALNIPLYIEKSSDYMKLLSHLRKNNSQKHNG